MLSVQIFRFFFHFISAIGKKSEGKHSKRNWVYCNDNNNNKQAGRRADSKDDGWEPGRPGMECLAFDIYTFIFVIKVPMRTRTEAISFCFKRNESGSGFGCFYNGWTLGWTLSPSSHAPFSSKALRPILDFGDPNQITYPFGFAQIVSNSGQITRTHTSPHLLALTMCPIALTGSLVCVDAFRCLKL